MKKLESILVILFIAGIILANFNVPGGATLGFLSALLLLVLYTLFGFAVFNNIPLTKLFSAQAYNGIPAYRIILAILTGFGIACSVWAILFTIQHWPGAALLRFVSISLVVPLTIVSIIFAVCREPVGLRLLLRLLPFFLLAMKWLTRHWL
ncbi:MAG: hypothetical protein JNL72_03000 [Flavipsychrobacter sp.]|nr:hypothetical protein [Flavipsychrobacter sp.]